MSLQDPSHVNAIVSFQSSTITAGGNVTINATMHNVDASTGASSVSRWLAGYTSVNQYAIQNATYEKVSPGTCAWILEKPEFARWISNECANESGTFWGMGIPGAGKTILTSYVVHHLKARNTDPHRCEPVSVFYCRYTDEPSMAQMLASILLQLVDCSPLVATHVKDTLYATCSKECTSPTQSKLESTIRTAIGVTPRAFIVIDALDELRDSIREELVEFLVSSKCSLFLTSREMSLGSLSGPDMKLCAPKADFQSFITREIDRLPKLRSLLRNRKEVLSEVVDSVVKKSDGMFLLSALQVSALGGVTTIASLRKAVQALPTTLADMYEKTLERINAQSEEERSLALRTILWIICAAYPLESKDLRAALAVEPDSTELDPDNVTDEGTLISVCCGLVTVSEIARFRLIHYTAHDFFTSRNEEPFNDPHGFAATICAVYRRLSCVDLVSSEAAFGDEFYRGRDRGYAAEYPFIFYAFVFLGQHTYQSTLARAGRIPAAVIQFLSGQQSLLVCELGKNRDRVGGDHFSAYHGLLNWFQGNPHDPNRKSDHLEATPLMYACSAGHKPVVKFLLGTSSVDINAHDLTGSTALSYAASHGHMDIVQLLLDAGASPLPACQDLHEMRPGIAQLLMSRQMELDTEALVELVRRDDTFCEAARRGNTELVKRLAALPGVNINRPFVFTPLVYVIQSQKSDALSLAKFLLDLPGINCNARGPTGQTALHIAAETENREDIVEILMRSPRLLIHLRDNTGRNALHYACSKGQAKSLSLLLRSGRMDINAGDYRGSTPLQEASYFGWQQCVELLLEYGLPAGLDLNARMSEEEDGRVFYATDLDFAIHRKHAGVVELLEGAGALRSADL